MDFAPRDLTLRDGATVRLRRVTGADAQAVLAHRRAEQPSMPYVLTLPEELPDQETQARQLDELDPVRGGLMIGAFDGPAVIGLCGLMHARKIKNAHISTIGVSFAEAWRNRGLGRAVMQTAIDWARAHPVILKLELEVAAVNSHAARLYRELGFVDEGLFRGRIRQPTGEYLDVIGMGLWFEGKA